MKTNRGWLKYPAAAFAILIALLFFVALTVWSIPGAKEIKYRRVCVSQLSHMEMGKREWGKQNQGNTNACAMADIVGEGKQFSETPTCPAGGVYILGKRNVKPTCSWHTIKTAP